MWIVAFSATLLKEECIDYLLQNPHVRRSQEWDALPVALQKVITEYGSIVAKKPKRILPGAAAATTTTTTPVTATTAI